VAKVTAVATITTNKIKLRKSDSRLLLWHGYVQRTSRRSLLLSRSIVGITVAVVIRTKSVIIVTAGTVRRITTTDMNITRRRTITSDRTNQILTPTVPTIATTAAVGITLPTNTISTSITNVNVVLFHRHDLTIPAVFARVLTGTRHSILPRRAASITQNSLSYHSNCTTATHPMSVSATMRLVVEQLAA
jgi:hypothetical protein